MGWWSRGLDGGGGRIDGWRPQEAGVPEAQQGRSGFDHHHVGGSAALDVAVAIGRRAMGTLLRRPSIFRGMVVLTGLTDRAAMALRVAGNQKNRHGDQS